MGRPSLYTPELVKHICERLAEGETLASILRDEGMPSYTAIMEWQREKPEVSADIARARDIGFDVIAERTMETARGRGDSTQDIQRDKLIVDTDLKLLAKWSPKRYGEKIDMTSGGEPINDAAAIESRLAFLLGKAGINPATGSEGSDNKPDEA